MSDEHEVAMDGPANRFGNELDELIRRWIEEKPWDDKLTYAEMVGTLVMKVDTIMAMARGDSE